MQDAKGALWPIESIREIDRTRDDLVREIVAAAKLQSDLLAKFKAGVFGVIIVTVSAWCGLRVTGGPEGVGRATTRAVVLGIFLVIVADLLFTGIFFNLA